MSHPTWVRGLKLWSRHYQRIVYRSHPTWVRGLKPIIAKYSKCMSRRTLRGCVD